MEEFEVKGATDRPNILSIGRYEFLVEDIVPHISQNQNTCAKITIRVGGLSKTFFLVTVPKGKATDRDWRQFLYAIGIRRAEKSFKVRKEEIIGKKGLVDVGLKERKNKDGTVNTENSFKNFLPLDAGEEAPIGDILPEKLEEVEEVPVPVKKDILEEI